MSSIFNFVVFLYLYVTTLGGAVWFVKLTVPSARLRDVLYTALAIGLLVCWISVTERKEVRS